MTELTWQQRADEALDSILLARELACDTEGTGIDHIKDGRHYMYGMAVAWREGNELKSFYFPFRHKVGENLPWVYWERLKTALNHKSKKLIWHHLKFDAHAVKTMDPYDPSNDLSTWECEFHDTMIEQHYLHEDMPKGLDFCSRVFLQDSKTDRLKALAKAIGWENIPSHVMFEYACHDTELTLRLDHDIFWPKIKRQDLEENLKEAVRYTLHLFKMEQEGVGVNLDFCAEMQERGEKKMAELIKTIGFDPAKTSKLKKYLLEDLGLPVVKWTVDKQTREAKNPSFDKEAMEKYDELLANSGNTTAQLVLQYRGWAKAVSSLYVPMQKLISPDGRIRTNLNDCGTVTGRLSSDSPNLQQIPRDSEKEWNGRAKNAFNSGYGDDWVLIGWDYAQLELRLGAHYGQDESLLEEFSLPDGDPFRAIGNAVFGDFNPEIRHKSKTWTYATGYGSGEANLAAKLGVSLAKVQDYYENYKARLPGYYETSEMCYNKTRERGYIKYWTGRRRRVKPEQLKMNRAVPFNSLLQGGGAELVKKAQLRAPHDENCRQVLQVHDEITFIIRRDMLVDYAPAIVQAMTDFPEIKCPLRVDAKEWNKV